MLPNTEYEYAHDTRIVPARDTKRTFGSMKDAMRIITSHLAIVGQPTGSKTHASSRDLSHTRGVYTISLRLHVHVLYMTTGNAVTPLLRGLHTDAITRHTAQQQ